MLRCSCGRLAFELIETLWNVNARYTGISFSIQAELIETLWNVNEPEVEEEETEEGN